MNDHHAAHTGIHQALRAGMLISVSRVQAYAA